MARQKLKDHPVLSHKEEEDIMFGKNRASNLSSGSRDSALQIVEQSIKKGGKVKRKRKKKKVSRKKIMYGYKAGGKV